ncbi:MAG: YjdF family protein [Oribacterium sp.]|nr:YjdF family protein [Oribacterium sp.]
MKIISEKCRGQLTVYFEDPFWVGVFERIENGKLSVSKVTFGAEPKDYEVQEFISRHYYHLQFSPTVKTDVKDTKKNPKRAQRDAKKQTLQNGIGTKSQQALKLQQEQNKLVRKERSRKEREAENDRLFEMKQLKKREKHKGH